jgi:hypothetical protein
MIFEAALSISRRSSDVSLIASEPLFSSRRDNLVVPGIGTIHGFCSKQPRQRDLRPWGLLLFRDSAQQIHQRLIRFAVFWSEARDDGTEIGAIELGIFGDFASEDAPAERAEWNEPDL